MSWTIYVTTEDNNELVVRYTKHDGEHTDDGYAELSCSRSNSFDVQPVIDSLRSRDARSVEYTTDVPNEVISATETVSCVKYHGLPPQAVARDCRSVC